MKMRKLISLISSLAIGLSMFTTVAFAGADGTIDLSVEVDTDGYYYVDFLFDVADVDITLTSRTEGRNTYFNGTGVYAGQLNFSNAAKADLYIPDPITTGLAYKAGDKDGELVVSFKAEKVSEMISEDTSGSATFLRLNTNYAEADKTADEIEAMFSEISFMNVKLVTVGTDTLGSADPASQTIVTYATYDGDFGCTLKSDEPTEVIATATEAGEKDATAIGDTYYGDTDTTDTAVAYGVGLMGEENQTYTNVLWTVTANGETKYHKSPVNVSGAATYKIGLVIQGLTKDMVTAVKAVLQ